ncbi:hypothetical protein UNDYM_5440 [Undibacterium sp. YM2]|uniref:YjfK family protein n=1 Tax=Undibacterium sp. YM2 TaxID=2058625 RepID=UPI001331F957|nr:YjfK family protein [Undibacterium sp. YM2]BBB69693.1 hypothetical protein UNDYM_5440 [Undibacterium sp. YM2]
MAWKDAYQYVGKLFNKHNKDELVADEMHAESGRQDAALPLGARIGSVVNLQKTPLIRAISQGSLIAMPDEAETRIVAISRVQLPISGKMYRYYLNRDADGNNGGEKFLQLYCDASGELQELLYCSHLTRLIPETVEDQQAFLGENGAGLGDRNYALWREQLAGIGWDEASLDSVFGDADSLQYERDAGDPAQEFVVPFKGVETRIDDAAGKLGLQQDVVFMPYRRSLNEAGEQSELLLISTEILRSKDGSSKRDIHVDFMIALPLEAERLLVQ